MLNIFICGSYSRAATISANSRSLRRRVYSTAATIWSAAFILGNRVFASQVYWYHPTTQRLFTRANPCVKLFASHGKDSCMRTRFCHWPLRNPLALGLRTRRHAHATTPAPHINKDVKLALGHRAVAAAFFLSNRRSLKRILTLLSRAVLHTQTFVRLAAAW